MKNTPIPLNDYQQLMLNISKLSPYNAVHAVPITREDLHVGELQQATTLIIKQLRLGIPQFSTNKKYVYFIDSKQPCRIAQSSLPLEEHMAREMNTRFIDDDLPLRFFIVTQGEQDYFAITYNHWIADAYSIMRLMEAIFRRQRTDDKQQKKDKGMQASSIEARDDTITIAPSLYLVSDHIETYFHKIYRYNRWYYRWGGFLGKLVDCATAYRTPITTLESTISGCSIYCFTPSELAHLLRICKSYQITLNDCFIALLAKLFGELTLPHRTQIPAKFLKGKRDKIVISIIANTRQHSTINLNQAFGLILGFFSLSFQAPEQYSLSSLCHIVSSQTKKFKRHNKAIKQYFLLKIQNLWWKWTKKTLSRYKLFSKNTPITVGISNINLNPQDWSFPEQIYNYVRCSPTAMVCPIIFNITTLNNQMSLAISYRKTCYSDHDVIKIKQKYLELLRNFIKT